MFLQKRHKIRGVINSNILGELRMKKAIVSFVILLMAVFFLRAVQDKKMINKILRSLVQQLYSLW